MKVCSGCDHSYAEEFKFCPECGRQFGGQQAADKERLLNQNLLDMKHQASREGALSRRVFSGGGLGDGSYGRVYGAQANPDL